MKRVKMSVVIVAFLFACNSGNRQNQTTVNQTDQISSVTTSDTVSESVEVNDNKKNEADTENVSESSAANNDETVDVVSKTVYGKNEKFKFLDWSWVEVKPVFDGDGGLTEYSKYIDENSKLLEITEENGIKEDWHLFYMFFIDTDGSVIDASCDFLDPTKNGSVIEGKIKEHPYDLLAAEMLRLVYSTNGKWTPGKHDDKPMKVRVGISKTL